MMSALDIPDNASETEIAKRFVISEMRNQTLAIRNWAYPEQTVRNLKAMFSGQLSNLIDTKFSGVSILHVIDALVNLAEKFNDKVNAHIQKVASIFQGKDLESTCSAYQKAFPTVRCDPDDMREVFERICHKNVKQLHILLMEHSDLHLEQVFTFSIDDFMAAYGDLSQREGARRILDRWAYKFGDLANNDPKHFLYSNPILTRPFIRLNDGSYFWATSGILSHILPGMLESIIPEGYRSLYSDARSKYLEDQVEALCKKYFSDGQVFRGCRWEESEKQYENDVLVIIDTAAIIIECKSHLIDPPARRGAEFRLVDTLEDIVVEGTAQAQRFADFLVANPKLHSFRTKYGGVCEVDSSKLLRFIPICVTYENLGFVSADIKKCIR